MQIIALKVAGIIFLIMSIMPRFPDMVPTREAESRVKITIGITYTATHRREVPNHAPARRRVATAPAPIIPAATTAAGPMTSRKNFTRKLLFHALPELTEAPTALFDIYSSSRPLTAPCLSVNP